MRSKVLIFLLILTSFDSFSQAPVLAVDRIDKRTKEHIRQSSMYLFKDGGDVAKLKSCFIAQSGSYYAHGETVEKALRDVRFKVAQVYFDASDLIAAIKQRQTVTFNDFRLLTGACESGLSHGMAQAGIDVTVEELPLADVIRLAHGSFGDAFRKVLAA